MEIIISVLLGLWIMLAGVLCLLKFKNDFKHITDKEDNIQRKDENA